VRRQRAPVQRAGRRPRVPGRTRDRAGDVDLPPSVAGDRPRAVAACGYALVRSGRTRSLRPRRRGAVRRRTSDCSAPDVDSARSGGAGGPDRGAAGRTRVVRASWQRDDGHADRRAHRQERAARALRARSVRLDERSSRAARVAVRTSRQRDCERGFLRRSGAVLAEGDPAPGLRDRTRQHAAGRRHRDSPGRRVPGARGVGRPRQPR
jgi:hypothetical protein